MGNGTGLQMGEEFAGLDFNSKRLEKRFARTTETLAGQPGKSIWPGSENRAEASETKFPQQYTECLATGTWTGKKRCGRIARRPSNGWRGAEGPYRRRRTQPA